jgi:hypothetical protein
MWLLYFSVEVEAAFRDFIWENTQIVTAEHTSKLILKRLRECGNDTALFQEIGGINFQVFTLLVSSKQLIIQYLPTNKI